MTRQKDFGENAVNQSDQREKSAMPALYIPHGAGPCFFVDIGFGDAWDGLGDWLSNLASTLPDRPTAILVISAHWEEPEVTINDASHPSLLYDYYGFPKEAYDIKYDASGSPNLAKKIRGLLTEANIQSHNSSTRGLDHGVFVPLKLVYPDADIPVVQVSLKRGLDPAAHLRLGETLSSLREEGVLIVGSGMSYHNQRGLIKGSGTESSVLFDDWLTAAVAQNDWTRRSQLLTDWERAPSARDAHPREEHLIPLMVTAGAAFKRPGQKVFSQRIMGTTISAYRFG